MREMLNIDLPWIEHIPKEWSTKRMKEFLSERKETCLANDGYQLLAVSEYYGVAPKKDVIKEGEQETRAESVEGYKICHPGDLAMNIMLAWKRAMGVSEYLGIISPSYAVFQPKKDIQVNMKFFHYLFRTNVYAKYFEGNSTGIMASRWRLYPDVFLSLRCQFPPFDEQSRIAAFLDERCAKIDEAVARHKALIEKLDEYRKAVITQAVTKGVRGESSFDNIPIKYLVNYNQSSLAESTSKDFVFDYVDIGSVSFENGIESKERMTFEGSPSRARRIVSKDDVIVSTVRTYLKAVAQIPSFDVPMVVSTGFVVLSAKSNKISPSFLGYAVKSEDFVESVQMNSYGISYPAIKSSEVVNLKVPVPSLEDQSEIVAFLDKKCTAIDSAKERHQQLITKLEEYKKSLIYNAVTGKLLF